MKDFTKTLSKKRSKSFLGACAEAISAGSKQVYEQKTLGLELTYLARKEYIKDLSFARTVKIYAKLK